LTAGANTRSVASAINSAPLLMLSGAHAAASTEEFAVARSGEKRRLGESLTRRDRSLAVGAPSFAGHLFSEVTTDAARDGAGALAVNTNLALRYEEVVSSSVGPLETVGALLLLTARITRRQLEAFYRADVETPVAVLVERPNRVYTTDSFILLRGGSDFGFTAHTAVDMTVGLDAATKSYQFNVSLWAAVVVKEPAWSLIIEDALVKGYGGGEGLVPYRRGQAPVIGDRAGPSAYYILVPYGSLFGPSAVRKTHDIRGALSPDLIEGRLTRGAHDALRAGPMYPSAVYANAVFLFDKFNPAPLADSLKFHSDLGRSLNTITHQTMQWLYDPVSKKFERPILNTDHFGPDGVYEGCGADRTSPLATFRPAINYKERYSPIG
jgi:hypothetical protein